MATEIEHKFLLANDDWREFATDSKHYKQGYLTSSERGSVRVRIADDKAWLNIKSATIGSHRLEYEYEIPVAEADEMLETLCHKPLIEKTRHFVNHDRHLWEIDEFAGENQGLIVAEVELSAIDEHFEKPSWVGQEVTEDVRYYNNNLCRHPYSEWGT